MKSDSATIAYNAAAAVLADVDSIDGMVTDAVIAFAFLSNDGSSKLAWYSTDLIHSTLGLATWLQAEMVDCLVQDPGDE